MSNLNRRQFHDLFDVVACVTATIDVASLADAAGETKVVTVTGAALGDFVIATPIIDAIDLLWTAYVQAANTVEIRVQNEAAGARNLASTTWRILVLRPSANAMEAAS
jgi:hypothetical protein